MDKTESNEAEIFRLKTNAKESQIELDTISAQNSRLSDENTKLRQEINLRTKEANLASSINVELKMMLFKTEAERDDLFNSLQSLKGKYNKLYDKYVVIDRTSRAMRDSLRSGNRPPSVRNSSNLEKRSTNSKFYLRPENKIPEDETVDENSIEFQKQLEQAYDRIDELEFELESIAMLEYENERLRNELSQLTDGTSVITTNIVPSAGLTTTSDGHTSSPAVEQNFNSSTSSIATVNSSEDQYEDVSGPVNKPEIPAKPIIGATSSPTVTDLDGRGMHTMMNLVEELHQFKFRNASQGQNK